MRGFVAVCALALISSTTIVGSRASAQTPTPTPTPTTPAPTTTTPPTPTTPTTPTPAAPVTCSAATPAGCEATCKDGEGDLAACVMFADALRDGRGIAFDRARALRLYRYACGLPVEIAPAGPKPIVATPTPQGVIAPAPPPTRAVNGTDAVACKAAAALHRTGWLFEIDVNPTLERQAIDRAIYLAKPKCAGTETSGCAIMSWAASERIARGEPYPDADPIKLAELGCTQGRKLDACMQLRDLSFRGGLDAESTRMRNAATAGMVAACTKDASYVACHRALSNYTPDGGAVHATLEKGCTAGNQYACGVDAHFDAIDNYRDSAKLKVAFKAQVTSCIAQPHELCSSAIELLTTGNTIYGIDANPAAAVTIAEKLCTDGSPELCAGTARLRGEKGPAAVRDADKARSFANRACALRTPSSSCFSECHEDETLSECKLRAAHRDHAGCIEGGKVGACERIAKRFQSGEGIAADLPTAASYLRRGCDGAEKSACIALEAVCTANPELPVAICGQALIHNDLFYEAEYQLSAGGDVDLVDAKPVDPSARTPGSVTVGDLAAQVPTSLRRGSLDADLVVNVVLDRARQAAIKLVVDELLSAEDRARYRYLRDLIDQGAKLLIDPTTLRREKFQDLAMTVVRAFVAANLIDGLYPTTTELRASKVIGATVIAGEAMLKTPQGKPLSAVMKGYLVDVAYYWLGQTRLFGRPHNGTAEPPICPWTSGEGVKLCQLLSERANAERAIGVDKVLDGLRLAKALRDGGFDDLRRLIEAASRSSTIADLGATPGLNLYQWQSQLVTGSRSRLDTLREGLGALRTLTRASTYSETGLDIAALKQRTISARAALDSASIRLSLGRDNIEHVIRMVRLIERADREIAADAKSTPGTGSIAPLALAKLRKDVLAGLAEWGPRDNVALNLKIGQVEKALDEVHPALDRLEASIADLRALLARFPDAATGRFSLDVGNIPLYAIGELQRELGGAKKALIDVDDGLHKIFPGEVNMQVRFARSATVRLAGFLDLMQRVARSSALTQRLGDVIAALRLLGTYRVGVFDAPLYDVLEPVIGSIRTHEPMSLELLFAVIGKVRIDTLIGTLQGSGNACKDEDSVDCWTTKLIHALQESVERTGNDLRIDGGKFAQRLAQHGDDFRKRNKWRGYFHLTVGVGGLHSDPVGDVGSARRSVPLVSEQVGIGLASPSFWGDRVTFKLGVAASGLLYRAVLDSEESSAVMVHPALLSFDLGELIEIYISPAMLMLYPPEDDRAGAVRWGFSAGINVPLAAYLERL